MSTAASTELEVGSPANSGHRVVANWRERVLAGGLLLLWLILGGRLVQLHLSSGEEFENVAARQRTFREDVPPRPGEVVDRHGRVFATSIAVRSVYVIPCRLKQAWDASRKLAEALELDPDLLFEKISSRPQGQFLWIKRRISDVEAERVKASKLPLESWGFREEYRRSYPQGTLAAHVVGMRDIDNQGQGGIEQSLNEKIGGQTGYRELLRDARGRVIDIENETPHPPRHGETVVLTLDAVVQLYAERSLDEVMREWKPKSCCAIVLAPQTGEILAMASRPTFDPNVPEGTPDDAWKNRTISDIYEPGSTLKPFIIAWALQHKVLKQDEVFHCGNGEYRMGKRVLHDHHPYGELNVVDILVKSSNIGMAKIGERMGNPRLFEAVTVFGFGGPTGIELPGELGGMLRPLKQWNSYSTGSVPMGQEIAVTPLQLISAYGALSNGGKVVTPHLVLASQESESRPRQVVTWQAVDPAIADWIRKEALTAVVSRGTGKKAEIKGFQVFGKTGTAQKPDPETGEYSNRLHVSSFVCGAPASDPQALVIVSVDEPSTSGEHFGGSIAAPAAGKILRKALQRLRVPLPPEDPRQSAAHEEAEAESRLE